MGLFRSLSGILRVEWVCADIPGLMDALNNMEIPIDLVQQRDEVTLCFTISRRQLPKMQKLSIKRSESFRIIEKEGLFYDFQRVLRRRVLVTGMLLLLFAVICIPSRVLFVQVSGNVRIPQAQILEAAAQCGIRFGANRREVRSERLKNALLESLEDLQWAGVNTFGCVAVISVRERSASEIGSGNGISYAVTASRDGVITSCTATRGNLLCSPGQAVKAGQLLISGYIDSGRMIRLTGAEGEIYAQTIHPLTIIMPSVWCSAVRNGETKEKISLILGKKRINLWKDSGIWDTTCGRIYSENYITLPGGFRLPVGLAVDTCLQASIASNQLTQQELENCLGTMAEQYLKNQMIAGQILSRTQLFEAQADACVLAGEYVCTEMIGRVQREQIGD